MKWRLANLFSQYNNEAGCYVMFRLHKTSKLCCHRAYHTSMIPVMQVIGKLISNSPASDKTASWCSCVHLQGRAFFFLLFTDHHLHVNFHIPSVMCLDRFLIASAVKLQSTISVMFSKSYRIFFRMFSSWRSSNGKKKGRIVSCDL